MKSSAKFFRNAILIPVFLFQACIPSLSKGVLQSVGDFLQLRSLVNTGPYKVSVTVSGLLGSGLAIDLNSGAETIVVNSDGSYEFVTALTTGSNFSVTIKTQPTLPVQTCYIAGGIGVVGFGNVNSIIVNCDPLRYTIGGTITGLDGITGLVLTNSVDGSTLNVAVASGTFAFTQTYLDGTAYNVTVTTQPNHPVQNCLVTNGSNFISGNNVTNIAIACNSTAFPIEITAVGIASGTLIIRNNNSEVLSIPTNGLHRFPTNIITNNTYSLQVVSTPPNHQCVLDSTGGTVTGTISVTANCFSVLSFLPSNGGILQPSESIRLQFSAEINAASCTGSTGTLNTNLGIPVVYSVTTTTLTNDTLIVAPAATDSWLTGHRTLTLNCLSVSGHPLSSSVTLLYLIPSNTRYVSQTGLDTNNGLTAASPKRNIQSAINDFGVCGSGDCAVLVEAGTYDSSAVGDRIQIVSGVSLYGSYTLSSNFSTRDTTLDTSIITMATTPASCAASTSTTPCSPIYADGTVAATTVVSGFDIKAGIAPAPFMAGISLNATNTMRFINNKINGGSGTGGTYGVFALNSNPYLILNEIGGGKCSNPACKSAGVYMSSAATLTPILLGNSINGGGDDLIADAESRAVFYNGSAGLIVSNIRGNTLSGGQVNSDPLITTSSLSIGLDIQTGASSTGILSGNIITAANAHQSIGIRFLSATSIQVGSPTQGNLITSGSNTIYASYGMYLSAGHTVKRNVIQTGNATNSLAAYSMGIYIGSGAGTSSVENNVFIVGNATSTTATAYAVGISGSSLNAASTINENSFRLGTATGSSTATLVSGIQLSNPGALLVSNNWIRNGNSNARARGMELSGVFTPVRIYHNTISSGSGVSNQTPIFITSGSSTLDIQNNILFLNTDTAGNACIHNGGAGLQTAIKFNNLFNCTNFVIQNSLNYTDLCGGIPTTSGCGIGIPLGLAANFGNNLNLNPNFVSATDYTPTPTTSCLITKSTNQIITNSYNGSGSRPGSDGAVSLGAVEYDYACTP